MRTTSKDLRVRMYKALLDNGYEPNIAHQIACYDIKRALKIVNKLKYERIR